MKVLWCFCNRISDNSMNVTLRNILSIHNHLKTLGHKSEYLSIISGADKESEYKLNKILNTNEQYDYIISVYTSFYVHIDSVRRLLSNQKNAKIVWFTTDYELSPNTTYAGGKTNPFDIVLAGLDHYDGFKGHFKKYYSLNLNSLVYKNKNFECNKKYDTIYYGRYREGREEYFKKYLTNTDILVSTSKKNLTKYRALGCNAKFIDKISWNENKETLNLFKFSLYIEDEFSHKVYTYPASRIYESLFCNTASLFDINSIETIKKGGFQKIDSFVYENKQNITQDEIQEYLKINQEVATEHKKQTLIEIVNIFESN